MKRLSRIDTKASGRATMSFQQSQEVQQPKGDQNVGQSNDNGTASASSEMFSSLSQDDWSGLNKLKSNQSLTDDFGITDSKVAQSAVAAPAPAEEQTVSLDAAMNDASVVRLADASGDNRVTRDELEAYSAPDYFQSSRDQMLEQFDNMAQTAADPSNPEIDFGDVSSLYGSLPANVVDSAKAVAASTGAERMTKEKLESTRDGIGQIPVAPWERRNTPETEEPLSAEDAAMVEQFNTVIDNFDALEEATHNDELGIDIGDARSAYLGAIMDEMADSVNSTAPGDTPVLDSELESHIDTLPMADQSKEVTEALNSRLNENSPFQFAVQSANAVDTIQILDRASGNALYTKKFDYSSP